MAATNGFYGAIQGPFAAQEQLMTRIQEDCRYEIDYITKLGIHYQGDFDLDLPGRIEQTQWFVEINGISFQIGQTRMLQLEDTVITSIVFPEAVNDRWYIDYQYLRVTEEEPEP